MTNLFDVVWCPIALLIALPVIIWRNLFGEEPE